MGERSIFARLGIKDARKAADELRRFGVDGEKGLERLVRAGDKGSKSLQNLDKASRGAQGGLRQVATAAQLVEGPLGGTAARLTAVSGLLGRVNPLLATTTLATAASGAAFGKATRAGGGYEQFLLRTEQQLRATGTASGLTTRQLDRLTFSIAEQTLAGTEGARRAAAALLTFRSVSGETFKETLRLAQDLASAGMGTLESNVVQLGKALEDPVRGMTALRRVGVTFTAQQQEMAKAMAEAGDEAGAQAIILGGLKDQIAGAGDAEAGGLLGAFDTLVERMGRLFEVAGDKSGSVAFMTENFNILAAAAGRLLDALDPTLEQRIGGINEQIAARQGSLAKFLDQTEGFQQAPGVKEDIAIREQEIAGLVARRAELLEQLRQQRREEEAARKAAEEAAAARRKETEEAKARAEAEKEAKRAQAQFDRERKAAIADLARLEAQAAQAGLKGIALLEVRRDQALEAQRERFRAEVIELEEFARARIAIEETFQREKAALEAREAERAARQREQEQKREDDKRRRAIEAEAKRQAELMQRPFVNAAENIQDEISGAFTSALRGTEFDAEATAARMKDIFARLFGEIATLAIARPIIVPVTTAITGALGVPQPGAGTLATALGGQGGGFNLLGQASGIFNPFGVFGQGGLAGAINSFGATLGFAPAAGATTIAGPGLGFFGSVGAAQQAGAVVPAGFLGSGATLAGTLGAAGIGALGASFLAPLVGLNPGTAAVGGGLGAGLGFAVGGPVGGIIGGLLGGLGGGLIGGKPKTPQGFAEIEVKDGRFVVDRTGTEGDKEDAEKLEQQAKAAAQQVVSFLNGLVSQFSNLGLETANFGETRFKIKESGAETPEEVVEDIIRAGGLTSDQGRIRRLLRRTSGEDLQDRLADASQVLAVIDPPAQGVAGGLEVLADQLKETRQAAKRVGFGADKVEKQFERQAKELLGLREAKPQTLDRSIKQLVRDFKNAGEDAKELGISRKQLRRALKRRAKELLGIGAGPQGPQTLAEAEAELERQFRKLREDAQKLGIGAGDLERAFQEMREELRESVLGPLRQFAESLGVSELAPISPAERFSRAQEAFDELAARARAGDLEAIAELPAAAQALLQLGRGLFASGPDFADLFARIERLLAQILGGGGGGGGGEDEDEDDATSMNALRRALVNDSGPTALPRAAPASVQPSMPGGFRALGAVQLRGTAQIVDALQALRGDVARLAEATEGQRRDLRGRPERRVR